METTHSRFARSGWLKLAAIALLVSVPFMLPKPARTSPSDATQNKGVSMVERDHPVSSNADAELQSPRPSKVRERNPRPENDAGIVQQDLSASSNSDRVDDPLVELGRVTVQSSGREASGPAALSQDGTRRAVASHTTGDATAAGSAAARPSRSELAVIRPPVMPISHLIDDDVAAEVAPEVPPDTMEAIRQSFEQEAGVNELAQDDPVYAQRWSKAELDAGERIRAMYGWGAFDEFQRKIVMEQLEAKKAQGGQ